MVTIQDPTADFATVVQRRRQLRAATNGEVFRLGAHGLDCGRSAPSATRRAVIGASAWALKSEQVEATVETIGVIGGLLTDLGYQVCPIGADAERATPTIVVWVCGDETEADEYAQLAAIGVPGLSIGSCVYGLDDWSYIEAEEIEDRPAFIRLFVDEVSFLVGEVAGIEDVSNNLSNEPRRTGSDDGERTAAQTTSDLHPHGRRRTRRNPPGRAPSGS